MKPLSDPSSLLANRLVAALLIGAACAGLVLLLSVVPGPATAVRLGDLVFYDWFYRNRPPEPQTDGEVVIIAVDERSLAEIDRELDYGWPWPRDGWALITKYLESAGARAVAFDLLFSERSATGAHDDETFASMLDETRIPTVMAREVQPDGQWGRFKPEVRRELTFGSVSRLSSERVYRDYLPAEGEKPSLALAAVRAAGAEAKLPTDRRFLLRFYGPHRDAEDRPTFPTYMASRVMLAQVYPERTDLGVEPKLFEGKLVVVGVMAAGTQDIKAAPHDVKFPGVEIQATAMTNLLRGEAVWPAPAWGAALVTLAAAWLAAAGAVGPRGVSFKVLTAGAVVSGVIALSFGLFMGRTAWWLPPVASAVAAVLAVVLGIAWSYFREDRRARLLLKAVEQCLSPSIAAQLQQDPSKLALGGRQMVMTVMFTDLAGFTELTEKLREKIEPVLNYYLGEMSEQVLRLDGTLDKFIGDAIMTFWNAPVDQPGHARHACDAALAIQRREREIRPQLESMGVTNVLTRIGINTGPMVVGFMGSARKLNYTVIGDAVNLAARLEPANKLYGTQILVAEPTVSGVRELFLFRQVDLLQVKGKSEPMAVYELMGDASARAGPLGVLSERFEAAFGHYRRQDWDAAEAILLELQRRFPDDGPAATLLRRIAEFRVSPPPTGWDGAYVAKSK